MILPSFSSSLSLSHLSIERIKFVGFYHLIENFKINSNFYVRGNY